jgi:hypothetical protein
MIDLRGGSSLTLNSGIYIIQGGISMAGGTTLTGTGGVMLYIASGSVNMAGGANVNVIAPTSGPYKGFAIFQPSSNTSAMSLTGGSTQVFQGAVYAPGAALSFKGGVSVSNGSATIVSSSLTFTGNSYISQPAVTAYSGSAGSTLLE